MGDADTCTSSAGPQAAKTRARNVARMVMLLRHASLEPWDTHEDRWSDRERVRRRLSAKFATRRLGESSPRWAAQPSAREAPRLATAT